MQLTKFSLLTTISQVIKKYKGKYCYASQETFLLILSEIHGIEIKRRALNKHLSDLRKEGLILSRKRITREENGTLCLQTSATCITIKGYELLIKEGVDWCKGILHGLKKKYMTWYEKKDTAGKQGGTHPCIPLVDTTKAMILKAKSSGKSLYDTLRNKPH